MPRKNRTATPTVVLTRSARRRARWNNMEVRGHADHGTARTAPAAPVEVAR